MRQGLTYLIRFLTMLGGVLLFAVSCEEEGVENIEPQIIVSEASYSVFEKGVKVSCGYSDPRDSKGKEQTVVISFVTTAEWSVTIGNGSVKWLTADPASGSLGEATVTLTIQPNESFDSRETAVLVGCGKVSRKFNVRQEGRPAIAVESITLEPTELFLEPGQKALLTAMVLPEDATDKTVTWSSSEASVVTVSNGEIKAVGKGSAVITAKAGDKSATCNVRVDDYVFSVSPLNFVMIAGPCTFDISVTATFDWDVDSKPDWVEVTEKRDDGLTFKALANSDRQARSGVMVICDTHGTCFNCQLDQDGYSVFSITPEEVSFNEEGGSFEITVACPTSYTVKEIPSWIHDNSSPLNLRKLVYKVDKFSNVNESRTASIVICDEAGTCYNCIVTQKGHIPDSAGGGNEEIPDGNPINW